MKLYAKTTSERASKGQGGNEFLKIDIMGENGESVISLLYVCDDGKRMYLSSATGNQDAKNVLINKLREKTTNAKHFHCVDCEMLGEKKCCACGELYQEAKGKKQKTARCGSCGEVGGKHSDDACEPYKSL